MIKDYPDVLPAHSNSPSVASSAPTSLTSSPASGTVSLPTSPVTPVSARQPPLSAALAAAFNTPTPRDGGSAATTPTQATMLVPPPPRAGPVLPPPRHPQAAPPQTTYTPYVPRAKRLAAAQAAQAMARSASANPATDFQPLGANGQAVPVITSSARGGVTTRHDAGKTGLGPPGMGAAGRQASLPHDAGGAPSPALLDKVRALDALPRLGALRTLDLRGNDIRVSLLVNLDSKKYGL